MELQHGEQTFYRSGTSKETVSEIMKLGSPAVSGIINNKSGCESGGPGV
jgi:hypothetical protein